MKRWIALFVALCLMLGGACAVAEEVAQASVAQQFQQNLQSFLGRYTQAPAVSCTTDSQGQTVTVTGVTGSEYSEMTLTVPGMDQPIILQVSSQDVYVSFQGQSYVLHLQDLPAILSGLGVFTALPMTDGEALGEVAQLLLMNTILPGINVEQNENLVHIQVNLTGKQMLAGLAAFGNQVLATEKYRKAVLPLVQFVLAQNGYQGDIENDADALWAQLSEQLQATESTLEIKADIAVMNVDADGASASKIVAEVAVTNEGATVKLNANISDVPAAFTAELVVSAQQGETSQEMLTANVKFDKAAKTLNGVIVSGDQEIRCSAAIQGNALQYKATGSRRGAIAWNLEGVAVKTGSELASTAQFTTLPAGRTTVSTLYWAKNRKSFTMRTGGEALEISVDTDGQGNFNARLAIPESGTITVRGNVSGNGLHAILNAERNGEEVGGAELTAVKDGNVFTCFAALDSQRATGSVQLFWSPASKRISLQAGRDQFALEATSDGSGALSEIRMAMAGRENWEVVYDGDLRYADPYQIVTAKRQYISATEAGVDVTLENRRTGEAQLQAAVRAQLPDENQLVITVTGPDGQEMTRTTLAITDAQVGEPLANQNPVVVDAAMIQQLVQMLTAQPTTMVEETAEPAA